MEMSHSPVWVISHLCSSLPSWLSGKSTQVMVPPEYSPTSSMNFVTASFAFMEVTPPMRSSTVSFFAANAEALSEESMSRTNRIARSLFFIVFLPFCGKPHRMYWAEHTTYDVVFL